MTPEPRVRRFPPGATACRGRGSRWWWAFPFGDRSPPSPVVSPLIPRQPGPRLIEMIESDPVDSWPSAGQAARLWS